MTQYGFLFDQSRCWGCQACMTACKSWHGLPTGPLKYLRIYEYEKGSFPNVSLHYQWVPCYHCEQPSCIAICPNKAIHKDKTFGAVLIDEQKCDGCRLCYDACPYGAPAFESDDLTAKARKCDMCIGRLRAGQPPLCVVSCSSRALDFGPLSGLAEKYGTNRELEDMPCSQATMPAVVFKPRVPKRQILTYDSDRALQLLMRRDPLPPVFSAPADVREIPSGFVGRGKLVIKHASADDLMRCTRNDEG